MSTLQREVRSCHSSVPNPAGAPIILKGSQSPFSNHVIVLLWAALQPLWNSGLCPVGKIVPCPCGSYTGCPHPPPHTGPFSPLPAQLTPGFFQGCLLSDFLEFEKDTSRCSFSGIYPVWCSLSSLDLRFSVRCRLRKILSCYYFKYFFSSFLFLLLLVFVLCTLSHSPWIFCSVYSVLSPVAFSFGRFLLLYAQDQRLFPCRVSPTEPIKGILHLC